MKILLRILAAGLVFQGVGPQRAHAIEVDENQEGYRAALAYSISKEICLKRTKTQDFESGYLRGSDKEFIDFCNKHLKTCLKPLTGFEIGDYPWERKIPQINTAAQGLEIKGATASSVGWCQFIGNGKDVSYGLTDCQGELGRLILNFLRTEEAQKQSKGLVTSINSIGLVPEKWTCSPAPYVSNATITFELPHDKNETWSQKKKRRDLEDDLASDPRKFEGALLDYLAARYIRIPPTGSSSGTDTTDYKAISD